MQERHEAIFEKMNITGVLWLTTINASAAEGVHMHVNLKTMFLSMKHGIEPGLKGIVLKKMEKQKLIRQWWYRGVY
ncbi:hypothetical protein METP1_01293 [Methanosarcinales archaeon]|nr:hypothetical protein METP1_01293 [Methanosarcinales archaeon]